MTKTEFLQKHFPNMSGNKPLKVAVYAFLYSASAKRVRRMYLKAKMESAT